MDNNKSAEDPECPDLHDTVTHNHEQNQGIENSSNVLNTQVGTSQQQNPEQEDTMPLTENNANDESKPIINDSNLEIKTRDTALQQENKETDTGFHENDMNDPHIQPGCPSESDVGKDTLTDYTQREDFLFGRQATDADYPDSCDASSIAVKQTNPKDLSDVVNQTGTEEPNKEDAVDTNQNGNQNVEEMEDEDAKSQSNPKDVPYLTKQNGTEKHKASIDTSQNGNQTVEVGGCNMSILEEKDDDGAKCQSNPKDVCDLAKPIGTENNQNVPVDTKQADIAEVSNQRDKTDGWVKISINKNEKPGSSQEVIQTEEMSPDSSLEANIGEATAVSGTINNRELQVDYDKNNYNCMANMEEGQLLSIGQHIHEGGGNTNPATFIKTNETAEAEPFVNIGELLPKLSADEDSNIDGVKMHERDKTCTPHDDAKVIPGNIPHTPGTNSAEVGLLHGDDQKFEQPSERDTCDADSEEEPTTYNNKLDSPRIDARPIEKMEFDHPLMEKAVAEFSTEESVQRTLTRLNAENASLKSTCAAKDDLSKRLQEENNTNLKKNQSLNAENASLKSSCAAKDDLSKRLQQDNNTHLVIIKSLKGEVAKLSGEKDSAETTTKQLQRNIDKTAKIMKKRDTDIAELKQKLSTEKETVKEMQTKHSKVLKEERNKASLIQHNLSAEIKQLNSDLDGQTVEYNSQLEKMKNYYEQKAKEQAQISTAIQASLHEEVRKREEGMQRQAKEHSDLLLRYSKLAGESLTMGNPNVTDLSDPNRPTKLAEQFSELYDNEWTDAFEEIEDSCDNEKIKFLLNILHRAYELSAEMTTVERLNRCYFTSYENIVDSEENVGIEIPEVPEPHTTRDDSDAKNQAQNPTDEMYEKESIKEANKQDNGENPNPENSEAGSDPNTTVDGSEAKEQAQNPTNEESNKEAHKQDNDENKETESNKEANKQDNGENPNPENNEAMYKKETNEEANKQDNGENPNPENNEATGIDRHDPINVEDAATQTEEPKDRKQTRQYLEVADDLSKGQRELDAMKLFKHIKKQTLSSASKEIQSVVIKCLIHEFNIPKGKDTKIFIFVNKCSELCLMMGLKDPPLYIDFLSEESHGQIPFRTDRYKAYTKKGKYLHYLVWPCLYLEKGGPLLSKGTAQGGDAWQSS